MDTSVEVSSFAFICVCATGPQARVRCEDVLGSSGFPSQPHWSSPKEGRAGHLAPAQLQELTEGWQG